MAKATKTATQPAAKKAGKTFKVTQVRSLIGTMGTHRATVRALGLRRINHTVDVIDTPATRGMVNKVSYLIKCEG